ncbi:MAG: hypothetical protein MJZ01_08020 [Bacteroidales bacterium]|nr:hypothetical protein [Bacteroidales bacterium]
MMTDLSRNRIGIGEIKELAHQSEQSPDLMTQIVNNISGDDSVLARNSAWVMTHFTNDQIDTLQERQNEFIDMILSTENTSLKRLLLNIIERQKFTEDSLRTDFLDFCLENMMSASEPPGVQCLCMKIAHQQCLFFPELLHEMAERLAIMQNGYATSTMGLRKKMLKKIEKSLSKD